MPTAVPATDSLDQKRLLKVLSDYRRGDFSARMPVDRTGLAGKICDTLNDAIDPQKTTVAHLLRDAGYHTGMIGNRTTASFIGSRAGTAKR